MRTHREGHDLPRLVFGAILIVLGVLFALDRFDVIDAGRLWDYWPLLLVAAGLARVLQPPPCHGRIFGGVLVALGVLLLLANLDLLPFRVWELWPLILIAIGVHLVLRAAGSRATETLPPPVSTFDEHPGDGGVGTAGSGPERVFATAILGGVERRVTSSDFRGGSLTAIMGGCEVDLRQAGIAVSPAVLEVFALWGGIEVRVPQAWTVRVEGTPVMGAIEDHTTPGGDGSQVLIVRGAVLMGGVEIKN